MRTEEAGVLVSSTLVIMVGFGLVSRADAGVGTSGWEAVGQKGEESWASPALMAIEVCTHRRNGELCRTSLYTLRFGLAEGSVICRAASSSSLALSRSIEAILAPKFFACCQPL